MATEEGFDYIVVGTGAGGSVITDYLSRDGDSKVLALESGGNAKDPRFWIPKGFYFLLNGGKFGQKNAFVYMSKPVGPNQAPEPWLRGRVDGGSASYNGSQYDRSSDYYWDGLEASGFEGWGWRSMVQVFKGYEDYEFGESETRGAGGPLHITVTRKPNALNDAFVAAAVAQGTPWVQDANAVGTDRIGFVPTTIKHGKRNSAWHAFLSPASKRSNVTHLHHAHVVKVLFSGKRAIGVQARVNGQLQEFPANKEVVLAGGSLETPQLLERSGIGGEEVLKSIGVKPVYLNPNVGEHLNEQRMISYQARINDKRIAYNKQLSSFPRQMWTGAKYLLTHKGVLAQGGYDLGMWITLMPESTNPDAFLLMNPMALDLENPGMNVAKYPGFSGIAYALHSETNSSIHATGSEPDAPPVIDSHFMETGWERDINSRMLQKFRDLAAQHPLADLFVEEQAPGPEVQSVEDAVAHAWASGALAHSVGSARMGLSDEDSVIDARLRVHGVEGLRVADTAAIPRQPGNTMAPTIAVGAKAVTMMLEDR